MTIYYEQFNQHKDAINWFYSKSDQEIWFWFHEDEGWKLTNTPSWHRGVKYVINDDKAEIRKAFIDGKQIEVAVIDGGYRPASDLDVRTLSANILRIKPIKPNFTIGDYITTGKPNATPFLCKADWMSKLDIDSYDLFAKWIPADTEPVWAWDNHNDGYMVMEYGRIQLNYDNIAPFTEQLPDKSN